MAFVAVPLAADDIGFNPAITNADFAQFSKLVAQGIFPTPVSPARASGVLGFDIGVAASAVKIDKSASYWQNSVTKDFTTHGYVGVPRLVAMKGFGAATVSGSYAKLSNSGIKTWGGALDVPLIQGSVAMPEIALRGSYATLSGTSVYHAKVYGLEAFISKGFGPLTPYAAVGKMRADATGSTTVSPLLPTRSLKFAGDINRLTGGVRFSMLGARVGVEVTRAEVTSYAAKISFGF